MNETNRGLRQTVEIVSPKFQNPRIPREAGVRYDIAKVDRPES